MASPERVELDCPLCGSTSRARTMGSSYYISGIESDLREIGSIEEVRRFSIAACQTCRYSDYSWDFLAPDELDDEHRQRLEAVLEVDSKQPGSPLNRTIGDFERLKVAAQCFEARGLDRSTMAELGLLAYYVGRDLGRGDLEDGLRDEAAGLLALTLEDEDLPGPLRQRYAYLAGELYRRAGKRDEALDYLDQAIKATPPDDDEEEVPSGALDIAGMARRMRAVVQYKDSPASELTDLTRGEDTELGSEARRLLATRRDPESVTATVAAWGEAPEEDRTRMLRELAKKPAAEHLALMVEALDSSAPEDIRLAARGMGALGDPSSAEHLLRTLERGVLSTESALVEALRRVAAPGTFEAVTRILTSWEERDEQGGVADDSWFFTSDSTPLRHLLYTSGQPAGIELLIKDLQALSENDLWDKVPSGGPVSAALMLSDDLSPQLRGLLTTGNPAARRWAAYCLANLGVDAARDDIAPLVKDDDQVVRLQAAAAMAQLGDPTHEEVVLTELKGLDDGDLPFALHFLVPFQSEPIKTYLLELLEGDQTTRCEILPLIGRQTPDERIQEILTTSLLETNDETRAGAVTGLAYQGGPDVANRLRLLHDQEESEEVQRRIIFGLGSLARAGHNRDETTEFLRERLARANPRLRFSMALTLLQLDDPTGIEIVRERAALFDESFDRYDLVSPALKALAEYAERHPEG